MTMPDDRIPQPVPVEIKNWAEPIKPPFAKNTTLRTYIIDPTGVAGPKSVQITDYEPKRLRMEIQVIDFPVVVDTSPPTASPDTCTATSAPTSGGRYLSTNATANAGYEFFAPDAMWLNSISTSTATRVTVTKEYS